MEDAIGKLIEPAADTGYVCDAGVAMTWVQMTANLEPEFYPANEVMYRDLLWAFGAVRRRDGSFPFSGRGAAPAPARTPGGGGAGVDAAMARTAFVAVSARRLLPTLGANGFHGWSPVPFT